MSDWVRTRRTRAMLTQEELAQRSGISVRTIRDLERGKIPRPYPSTLRRLDAALSTAAGTASTVAAHEQHEQHGQDGQPRHARAVHQLPPDLPDFTGRAHEREHLAGRLLDGQTAVCAIAGLAGVGKTALAVHVAHRVRGEFPDGQLFVDLGGAQGSPLPPAAALARFLRALGVANAAVPDSLDERSALYRSTLAGRRVLVVLDNAAGEAQVRPLLVGEPSCAVLVTSRRRLDGLAGARTVTLDVLDRTEAADLFASVAELPTSTHSRRNGQDIPGAHRHAVEQIVDLCGRLPLAIRIAGVRLAARPAWTPQTLVALLADEHSRLDVLTAGDLRVRSSFALSYHALPERHRRAFRRLGLLAARRFPSWAAKAVLDDQGTVAVSMAAATRIVEDLVDARLLDSTAPDSGGNARYGMHDLIRVYARERALAEDADAPRLAALTRALSGWLDLALLARRRLDRAAPDSGTGDEDRTDIGWRLDAADASEVVPDATEWFEIERDALASCADQAAAIGAGELARQLAGALCSCSALTSSWARCRHAHEVGLAAGGARGTVREPGSTLRRLGRLCALTAIAECDLAHTPRAESRLGEALEHYEHAKCLHAAAGNRQGTIAALIRLGRTHLSAGRLVEAARDIEHAQALARETHSETRIAYARQVLGDVYIELGKAAEARIQLGDALTTARELTSAAESLQRALTTLRRVDGRAADRLAARIGRACSLTRAAAARR